MPTASRRRWLIMAYVVAVLLIALTLRVWAAGGELWFDEVWSLNGALEAGSVHAVLTLNTTDNNHPLNALWMLLLGDGRSELLYRLLSIVTGMITVWLGAAFTRRWGQSTALTSDQDRRHSTMLSRYARPPLTDLTITYIGMYPLRPSRVNWYLAHARGPWPQPFESITDKHGNRYDLAAHFRSDLLLGYHLALFRFAEQDPESSSPRSPEHDP